jgi:hypothetical protein
MQTIIDTAHNVAPLIPYTQYAMTIEYIERFETALIWLEKQLEGCPALKATEGMEEHPAIFHYFYSATDIYICEYDGDDTMFGFTILNGDVDNSEWGYISLAEICDISTMNIDYYFKDQTIEAARYLRYPRSHKKPVSLEK